MMRERLRGGVENGRRVHIVCERGSRVAQQLADKLVAQGYSVWWDTSLVPGSSFRPAIVTELKAAKRVLVIWSPSSVKSDWVISEADRAAKASKLIGVRVPGLDIHSIPPPFDQKHTMLIDEVAGSIKLGKSGGTSGEPFTFGPVLRGLFRIWLVLSAIWLIGWASSWAASPRGSMPVDLILRIAMLPPIGVLVAVTLTIWIYRGFRSGR